MKIQTATNGMTLTNGESYTKTVYLHDDAANWAEIPDSEVPVQETEVVKEVKKTPVRKAKTTASTESKAKPKHEHERKENEKAAEKVTGTKKSK